MSDKLDEWQVARRRKGAAKKSESLKVSSALKSCQEHLDINKTVKRVKDTVLELRCEEFWQEWQKELSAASSSVSKTSEQLEEGQHLECVCYGLGNFSSCVSARFQLAMLLLLLEAAQIPLKDCSIYDPAFSPAEEEVLRELGLTVLTENEHTKSSDSGSSGCKYMASLCRQMNEQCSLHFEEGKRVASKPTLFYLMHCGKALYNNLLWKNWRTQCLSMLVIIGNSFSGIRERTIDRELQRDYSYISKAVDLCEERQLPCPSRLIDVFSDTSVISFPSDSLQALPQSIWTDSPEPQYPHCPDLEIILKET